MIDSVAVAADIAAAITQASTDDLRGRALATDSPAFPCVVVPLPEIDYWQTGDGTVKATYTLRFLSGPRKDEDAAQRRLSRWFANRDLLDAIEAATDNCDSIIVVSTQKPQVYPYGSGSTVTELIGADMTVEVVG